MDPDPQPWYYEMQEKREEILGIRILSIGIMRYRGREERNYGSRFSALLLWDTEEEKRKISDLDPPHWYYEIQGKREEKLRIQILSPGIMRYRGREERNYGSGSSALVLWDTEEEKREITDPDPQPWHFEIQGKRREKLRIRILSIGIIRYKGRKERNYGSGSSALVI